MNELSFLCDAIYRGSEIVEGAVSPNKLTSLAEIVLSSERSAKGYAEICIDKLPRGERCQLQIDEERLRVSSSRKDEGFESDSESSSTASGSLIEEAMCGSPEIKVIKDHVLRLEKLIRQDSGIHHCAPKVSTDGGSPSISSSSGAESEEDAPKRLEMPTATDVNKAENTTTALPTTTSLQTESGNGDNFLLSDILFCHVMSHRPKLVIVVVKSLDSHLIAAHLFECLSQEAARTLYTCYYTASNKYKLNRYRKSKRRLDGYDSDNRVMLDRIHVSIRNIKKKHFDESENPNHCTKESNYTHNKPIRPEENQSNYKKAFRNMYNGDTTNINIIEIKDSHLPVRVPNGMLQRTDENGVTHIEIESAPCSLVNPLQENKTLLRTTFDCQEVLSALDRLSIHSSNNPNSYLNFIGVTSSCPNSLIAASREIHSNGEKEKEKKLRQRQPPLLIRKDHFRKVDSLSRKEIRKREIRNRSRSEERNENDEKKELIEQTKQQDNCITSKRSKETVIKSDEACETNESEFTHTERQSRLRNTIKSKEDRTRPRSNHNKGPAPPPPTRKHTNNPSVMLVPTKSGQENSRSYYPKESHIVRGSKLVRIDYPIYPPWNMNSDINNNPKRLFYAHPGWMSSHEYHSSRYYDSGSHSSDLRKRSRSKSPARRPMAHRYIDVVSTFSLSQKLKDLSDNLIQSWKNSSQGSANTSPFISNRDSQERTTIKKEKKLSTESAKSNTDEAIRPVIKRGKKIENNPDLRRVTFSAFATVQLMDS